MRTNFNIRNMFFLSTSPPILAEEGREAMKGNTNFVILNSYLVEGRVVQHLFNRIRFRNGKTIKHPPEPPFEGGPRGM